MNYAEWEKAVPPEITGDTLWKVEAYRLALFAADLAWHDATKLMGDRRSQQHASQLFAAVGSVSANIAEGYSRGTGRDRARFYEYALGSAREARTWYYQGRQLLGPTLLEHRLAFLTQISRLLLKMIPDQRGRNLRETGPAYGMQPCDHDDDKWDDRPGDVPMPSETDENDLGATQE